MNGIVKERIFTSQNEIKKLMIILTRKKMRKNLILS